MEYNPWMNLKISWLNWSSLKSVSTKFSKENPKVVFFLESRLNCSKCQDLQKLKTHQLRNTFPYLFIKIPVYWCIYKRGARTCMLLQASILGPDRFSASVTFLGVEWFILSDGSHMQYWTSAHASSEFSAFFETSLGTTKEDLKRRPKCRQRVC